MAETAVALDDTARRALLRVRAGVPEDAMTAGVLGTEREGHALRIRADGLALTVGYLLIEADTIWLTNSDGESSPAHVIAQDHESGLALVRPDLPIGLETLPMRRMESIEAGAFLRVLNGAGDLAMTVSVAAVGEFAGRWEYVIDRALYTVPACDDWGGAALLDDAGSLIGIGSLFLELPTQSGSSVYGNMFVPVELIMDHVDDLCLHGARRTRSLPWLGWMVQEHEGGLAVVGIYPNGPAEQAGISLGDIVTAVAGEGFDTLGDLFRAVRAAGSAGEKIRVAIERDGSPLSFELASVDRNAFFEKRHSGPVN